MNEDEKWMKFAIKEANKANNKGEVPVGAILVKDQKIISRGHNQPISTNDATAHAEIIAIRKASKAQNNYRLVNTTLYVTLEPCAMCLGALVHARVTRIVFGAPDFKTGVCGSCADLSNETFFNHKIAIHSGMLEIECKAILTKFFFELRKRKY
jgi:tRNA(adenine34) deaminase